MNYTVRRQSIKDSVIVPDKLIPEWYKDRQIDFYYIGRTKLLKNKSKTYNCFITKLNHFLQFIMVTNNTLETQL